LVKGTELYDIHADPGQTSNVAADQPAVLSRMRAHYERWWARVEPQRNDFVPTSLGAEQQPLVSLTSSDWENIYCDNAGHIRKAAGGPQGGHWNVFVERAGEYEISLRRWPRETGLALGDPSGADSVSFRIAAAVVEVAGQRLTARTAPTAREVVLRTQLPRGRATLHAWFQDDRGKDVCGAFYSYVRRLP
jgi:hypothetical protein